MGGEGGMVVRWEIEIRIKSDGGMIVLRGSDVVKELSVLKGFESELKYKQAQV